MKYPFESNSGFEINVINHVVQIERNGKDVLQMTLIKHLDLETTYDVELSDELKYVVGTLQSLASSSTTRFELVPIFIPEPH